MSELTTDYADLEKVSNKVVRATYKLNKGHVDEHHINDILRAAASHFDGKPIGLYVVTGTHTLLSLRARKKVINETKNWHKMAIHTHNLGQKIMGNFVMSMKGVNGSLRIFTDEKEALKWLELD